MAPIYTRVTMRNGEAVPVAGFFAWIRTTKGPPSYDKYSIERETMIMPETKRMYEAKTIKAFELTEAEFAMSLEQLAELFPCPTIIE